MKDAYATGRRAGNINSSVIIQSGFSLPQKVVRCHYEASMQPQERWTFDSQARTEGERWMTRRDGYSEQDYQEK